jgi:thioredoxin-related protein
MSNVELTRFFGIRGFPSLVFLDPDANPITLVPGFMPAPQFLAILNYIDQRCYQTKISFQEFVQNGDCD